MFGFIKCDWCNNFWDVELNNNNNHLVSNNVISKWHKSIIYHNLPNTVTPEASCKVNHHSGAAICKTYLIQREEKSVCHADNLHLILKFEELNTATIQNQSVEWHPTETPW